MRQLVIPASILGLGMMSLITLSSIAPGLAPRQLVFFVIGGLAYFFISQVSFKKILDASWIWYGLLCLLLIATLIFGEDTRGTSRWINVAGLFVIQASQLAIPLVTLALVNWLKTNSKTLKIDSLPRLFTALSIIIVPALLILVEPDLGTTIAYLSSVAVVFLFVKIKKIFVISLIVSVLLSGFIGWNFVFKDYQKSRITSFVNQQDFQGANYNAQQALIAVGSGQLLGRGLGQGVQSHLKFLPERQTDFIFASFSEEFGFLGALVMLALYVMLISSILKVGLSAESQPQTIFCMVIATMISTQTIINVGMNIGLLPITGITLPIFSSGGSSVISIMATLGIVASINKERKKSVSLSIS